MSQRIQIQVTNKIATCLTEIPVVCGNSDYEVEFLFDDEWSALDVKTGRFKVNGNYTDVVFSGNVCNMPIIRDAKAILVGVFAGELSTTTPALVYCSPSILEGSEIPAPPTDDVYNQIIELLNEYIEQGGGGGSGVDGEDGATFIPNVSTDGILSWTNDKNLPNPTPVNIKGKDGKDGKNGIDGVDGKDGKTPIKGVDYWTEADKAEMKADVVTMVGDIDSVLDAIIAKQTEVLGGDT